VNKVKEFIKLLRVHQWIKNVFIFSPMIFSKNFFNTEDWRKILLTFMGFSLVASSSYVLNDIVDREKDRLHPVKKNRPIASGKISVLEAVFLFIFLFLIGVYISYSVDKGVALFTLSYFFLILLYSLFLKRMVFIDMITIAIGFDIRALVGAYAIRVELSSWLVIDLFLLALFLAATKRRQELIKLKDADKHKKVLSYYSLSMIDQIIPILTSTTLISYIIYTLSPKVSTYFGTEYFYLTVPFVVYGIFRYLYIIYNKDTFGDPTYLLIHDWPLILDIILWGISIIALIYLY